MTLISQLEQMHDQGKKVVSIEFLLIVLRGIPPTHQENVIKASRSDFVSDNDVLRVMGE